MRLAQYTTIPNSTEYAELVLAQIHGQHELKLVYQSDDGIWCSVITDEQRYVAIMARGQYGKPSFRIYLHAKLEECTEEQASSLLFSLSNELSGNLNCRIYREASYP